MVLVHVYLNGFTWSPHRSLFFYCQQMNLFKHKTVVVLFDGFKSDKLRLRVIS